MYNIDYRSGAEFLRAEIRGDLTEPQTRIDAWSEVIRRCRLDGVTRLLVVQESLANDTDTTAFTSSQGILGLGLDGLKIAYVDIDQANYEVNKFGELVATNRGANARSFYEEATALDWLLS